MHTFGLQPDSTQSFGGKKDSTDHHLFTGLGLKETKKEGRKEGRKQVETTAEGYGDGSISSGGGGWPHL